MTAPEEAIAALRQARPELPESVTSPTSEAAQALLEEILSMRIPEIDLVPADPAAVTHPAPRRPRRSRRPLVLAAAAVAVAGVAAVAVVIATTGDGNGDVTVDVGPASDDATTLPAVPRADAGRLHVTAMSQWGQVPPMGEDTTYSWSGDDFEERSGLMRSGVVDDRAWNCGPDLPDVVIGAPSPEGGGSTDEIPYTCDDIVPERPAVLDIDPATLLDRVAAAGPFTPVGDEDVEGVPTQRRRATNPAATPLDALFFSPIFPDDANVTSLELWVDGDDRVLRADVAVSGVGQGQDFTHTISYVWYDLGEPITIQPVAAGDLVDPAVLADLLEYSIDHPVANDGDAPVEVVPVPDDEAAAEHDRADAVAEAESGG